MDRAALEAGMARAFSMLERAATLEVGQAGDALHVRITNETGHKLPTGFPEGRRMWINVEFFDSDGELIAERGAYDSETAELTIEDTEVYEIALGIDDLLSRVTGLPVGETLHVVFCNVIYRDNRIPPRGFTNKAYREIQSPVVAAGYSDGQYWDDTQFVLPIEAAKVTVRVYYQTASKEFIEFLRDANFTNDAGRVLYEQWEITGKSPPVLMVSDSIDLSAFATGDYDGDRDVDLEDHAKFAACLKGPNSGPVEPECKAGDLNGDDDVDLGDFARFQHRFGGVE